MSYNEQYSIPFSTPTSFPVEQESGWSGKKKAGVAVSSIAALSVAFFAGTEVGYNNAKKDIVEAVSGSFNEKSTNVEAQRAARNDLSQETEANYPVVLSIGDSVDAPCSTFAPTDDMCMTITLTEATPDAVCPNPYVDSGRYVVLDFEASTRSDTDSDFFSPFSIGQWSAITADNRKTNVLTNSACEEKGSYADLSANFPGYSASGTAWIKVPDNTIELQLEVARNHLFSVSVD